MTTSVPSGPPAFFCVAPEPLDVHVDRIEQHLGDCSLFESHDFRMNICVGLHMAGRWLTTGGTVYLWVPSAALRELLGPRAEDMGLKMVGDSIPNGVTHVVALGVEERNRSMFLPRMPTSAKLLVVWNPFALFGPTTKWDGEGRLLRARAAMEVGETGPILSPADPGEEELRGLFNESKNAFQQSFRASKIDAQSSGVTTSAQLVRGVPRSDLEQRQRELVEAEERLRKFGDRRKEEHDLLQAVPTLAFLNWDRAIGFVAGKRGREVLLVRDPLLAAEYLSNWFKRRVSVLDPDDPYAPATALEDNVVCIANSDAGVHAAAANTDVWIADSRIGEMTSLPRDWIACASHSGVLMFESNPKLDDLTASIAASLHSGPLQPSNNSDDPTGITSVLVEAVSSTDQNPEVHRRSLTAALANYYQLMRSLRRNSGLVVKSLTREREQLAARLSGLFVELGDPWSDWAPFISKGSENALPPTGVRLSVGNVGLGWDASVSSERGCVIPIKMGPLIWQLQQRVGEFGHRSESHQHDQEVQLVGINDVTEVLLAVSALGAEYAIAKALHRAWVHLGQTILEPFAVGTGPQRSIGDAVSELQNVIQPWCSLITVSILSPGQTATWRDRYATQTLCVELGYCHPDLWVFDDDVQELLKDAVRGVRLVAATYLQVRNALAVADVASHLAHDFANFFDASRKLSKMVHKGRSVPSAWLELYQTFLENVQLLTASVNFVYGEGYKVPWPPPASPGEANVLRGPTSFDMLGAVREASDLFASVYGKSRASIVVAGESGLMVYSHRPSLMRCVERLLSNAVNVSESPAAHVRIDISYVNQAIQLQFWDDGQRLFRADQIAALNTGQGVDVMYGDRQLGSTGRGTLFLLRFCELHESRTQNGLPRFYVDERDRKSQFLIFPTLETT